MLTSHTKRAALFLGAAAMFATAADARPVFIHYEGVDGEAQAADDGHKEWIPILSLRIAGEERRGGVSVAAGDVNGDGAAEAQAPKIPRTPKSGDVTLKRGYAEAAGAGAAPPGPSYGPVITIKPKGDQTGPADLRAPNSDPVPIGLLLPAVQKVREATVPRPAGAACSGQKRMRASPILEEASGATGTIVDGQVIACSAETITFTFSKIDWD